VSSFCARRFEAVWIVKLKSCFPSQTQRVYSRSYKRKTHPCVELIVV
jgi:hypothetical protein